MQHFASFSNSKDIQKLLLLTHTGFTESSKVVCRSKVLALKVH